ncbi:MAG: diguanylate cyclase [Gemmatimonadales bacterium]|nr:diguanylate cyclase [Gemmatimonadales bacterium]
MSGALAGDDVARPRVLLAGDAAARPDGLERALTRAGLHLIEAAGAFHDASPDGPSPDAVLVTLSQATDPRLLDLLAVTLSAPPPPRIVLLSGDGPEGSVAALALGADDAVTAPCHLPELAARIRARIRDRHAPLPATAEVRASASGLPSRLNGRSGDSAGSDTGIPGPAALDTRLREEFDRARRYSLGFSIVLLDVNELQAIDDRLGDQSSEQPAPRHDAGIRFRREVGALIRSAVRVPDFVSLAAGDEFALVLPETGVEGARRSVVRVRDRLTTVMASTRSAGAGLRAGIATYPHPAVNEAGDLLALVEAALARGRSQTSERIAVVE